MLFVEVRPPPDHRLGLVGVEQARSAVAGDDAAAEILRQVGFVSVEMLVQRFNGRRRAAPMVFRQGLAEAGPESTAQGNVTEVM